jgi:hypothetical protein
MMSEDEEEEEAQYNPISNKKAKLVEKEPSI